MSKFKIPVKKQGIFPRIHLYDIFDNDVYHYKLTYMCGYPGTGKTYCVIGWLKNNKIYDETRVEWIDCRTTRDFACDWNEVHIEQKHRRKRLIVLDHFEMIEDSKQRNMIRESIQCSNDLDRYLVISRGRAPLEFMVFFTTNQISIIDADKTMFLEEESKEYLKFKGLKGDYSTGSLLNDFMWSPAIMNLFFIYDINPYEMDEGKNNFLKTKIMDYLDHSLFYSWSKGYQKLFVLIAPFPEFTVELIERLTDDEEIIECLRGITSNTCFVEKIGVDLYRQEPQFMFYTRSVCRKFLSEDVIHENIKKGASYFCKHGEYDRVLGLLEEIQDYKAIANILILSINTNKNIISLELFAYYLECLPTKIVKRHVSLIAAKGIYYITNLEYDNCERWYYEIIEEEKLIQDVTSDRKKRLRYCILFFDIFLPYSDEAQTIKKIRKYKGKVDYSKYVSFFFREPILLFGMLKVFHRWIVYAWNNNIDEKNVFQGILGADETLIFSAYRGYYLLLQNKIENAIYYIMKCSNDSIARGYRGGPIMAHWCMYRIMLFNHEDECAMVVQREYSDYATSQNILQRTSAINLLKLLGALYTNDLAFVDRWWKSETALIGNNINIISNFKVLMMIRVCILKKSFYQGLALLDLYNEAVVKLKRWLECQEVYVLYAILHYRNNQPEKTLYYIKKAVEEAKKYHTMQGIVNEGNASYEILLEYLKAYPNEKKDEFVMEVVECTKKMANKFPYYLKEPRVELASDIRLTKAEINMLEELATDKSNSEIAETLCISLNTVKHHTKNIYAKLNVNTRNKAVALAKEIGLIKGGLY